MRVAHSLTVAAAALALLLSGCQSNTPAATSEASTLASVPSSADTTPPTGATTPTTATVTVTATPATPTKATPTKAKPTAAQPAAGGLSRTYAEAQRRIQAATDAGRVIDPEEFASPSRNIICSVVPADAVTGGGCEIDQGRIPERRCDTGGGGARDVGRIVFRRGVPTPECNSDTMFSSRSQRVLAYGWVAHVRQGSVECLSERAGVTCIDGGARRGFALSRGSFRLLR